MAWLALQVALAKRRKAGGKEHLLPAAAAVLLWVFVGAFFYWGIQNCTTQDIDYSTCPEQRPTETCGWSFAQSFYYSVQTGLSIGFGLLAEDKDISRLYSVLHILAGSSFIAGALALFASVSLERNSSWQTDQEKRLAAFSASMHENGYKGLNAEEMVELMMQQPTYLKDVHMKLNPDNEAVVKAMQKFDSLSYRARKNMCIEAMKEAHEKLDEFKDGRMTIDELRALHRDHRSPQRRLIIFVRNNQGKVTTYGAFLLWITIGVVYGVAQEKWNFVQSLYFAVSTLSTAGLQAVTPCGHQFNVTFAALYALIGVPIFGMTLGSFANVLVDNYNKAKFHEETKHKVTQAEVEFVEHLMDREHADTVDLSEFLQIQLLRLGKVDRSDLEGIKERFQKLDPTNSGRVAKGEFLKNWDRHKAVVKEMKGKPEDKVIPVAKEESGSDSNKAGEASC